MDAVMHYHQMYENHLDIEDDELQTAKELARYEGSPAGRVISELARRGLEGPNGRPAKTTPLRKDANVIIALLDADHTYHAGAHNAREKPAVWLGKLPVNGERRSARYG